jgi:hypothetical protein
MSLAVDKHGEPLLPQVLEVLLAAVGVRSGQPEAQRAANSTAVAMSALAGLGPLVRRSRSEGGGGDQVAGKVLQLASCMLEGQVGSCLGVGLWQILWGFGSHISSLIAVWNRKESLQHQDPWLERAAAGK